MKHRLSRTRSKIDWTVLPVILSLAWPTMLEELMLTAVQYIDTFMVGTLGTEATAAVGATNTVGWMVGISISGIGVGFLSYIAKAIGAGDHAKAAKASSQGLLLAVLVGAFATVLTLSLHRQVPVWMQVDPAIRDLASRYFFILYTPVLFRAVTILCGTMLRASGDTKTPMRVGILVNLTNVVLNFLLIYPTRKTVLLGLTVTLPGAGLGVIGAAVASAISVAMGGILIAIKLWKHPVLSPRGQSFRPDGSVLRPCLKVSLPSIVQRMATSFGYVVFAAMINSAGEVATAAHTIANTVESMFYIPGFGMQSAAATLAGNALGARDSDRLRRYARMNLLIEVVLMAVTGGLLFAFAPQMMDLFSNSEDVIRLGSTVLRMVAVSEPFYGVALILDGMHQGLGNTMTPFRYNLIGMWGVRITCTFVLTQLLGYGLVAAWACMILHNMLIFTLYTIRYTTGRWNPLRSAPT